MNGRVTCRKRCQIISYHLKGFLCSCLFVLVWILVSPYRCVCLTFTYLKTFSNLVPSPTWRIRMCKAGLFLENLILLQKPSVTYTMTWREWNRGGQNESTSLYHGAMAPRGWIISVEVPPATLREVLEPNMKLAGLTRISVSHESGCF